MDILTDSHPVSRLEIVETRRRRRYVATTDSDHELPIFPNLAKTMVPDGPSQLWVTDITYVELVLLHARNWNIGDIANQQIVWRP